MRPCEGKDAGKVKFLKMTFQKWRFHQFHLKLLVGFEICACILSTDVDICDDESQTRFFSEGSRHPENTDAYRSHWIIANPERDSHQVVQQLTPSSQRVCQHIHQLCNEISPWFQSELQVLQWYLLQASQPSSSFLLWWMWRWTTGQGPWVGGTTESHRRSSCQTKSTTAPWLDTLGNAGLLKCCAEDGWPGWDVAQLQSHLHSLALRS